MVSKSRTYFVWRCENTHETMRPLGKKISEGCLGWMIKSTKHSNLEGQDVQGKCKTKDCGRKPRLHPFTTNMYRFETKDAATAFCHQMNTQGSEF